FDQAMENLRMIPWPKVPFEYPLRTRYLMAAELDARGIPRAWSSRERLGLSAYLIRREKYRDAQQLLERTIQQEPHNFVALANLAAAYQKDRVDEAISYAKRAIKSWPEWQALTKEQQELMKQLRWDPEQFEHYRRVEPYFLKLMERRRKEPPKQPMVT